ncbi:MAG TPA: helix-turn-helix domain-containing protein [Candidatus Limnocylindrales bacterium]|nr:helix-turn-helix domain-containing protein [Candidatus Limnocylindrales bacterium]
MDDAQVGRALFVLRRRAGLPQHEVARRVGVSQATVSRLERGHIGTLALDTMRRVFAAVDARVAVGVSWRSGALDRLLDQGHAELVAALAQQLTSLGWQVAPEVTYSRYGERGSIDLLGGHVASRAALICEVKTELASLESTLRRHDAKVRLAPLVAAERFGWRPVIVGGVLVLPEDRTARRRVARHAAVLDGALPMRGHAVRAWLKQPAGPLNGILFLSSIQPRTHRQTIDTSGAPRGQPSRPRRA